MLSRIYVDDEYLHQNNILTFKIMIVIVI